jgi:excisionase family DNA binding protein
MLAANTFSKTTTETRTSLSATRTVRPAQFEDPVDKPLELQVDVKIAARFLGVSCSLVYSYVERKQISHYRMMGRAIRFRLSELATWREKFHVDGGIDE